LASVSRKSGHFRRNVNHLHKMGFFRDYRNSKTAGLGPPLVCRKSGLFTDVNRLVEHVLTDVVEEGGQIGAR
jgi:hypothetical protein